MLTKYIQNIWYLYNLLYNLILNCNIIIVYGKLIFFFLYFFQGEVQSFIKLMYIIKVVVRIVGLEISFRKFNNPTKKKKEI